MPLSTQKPLYQSPAVDLTLTMNSIATSSGKTVGQEGTLVDNTTTRYDDFILSGNWKTGTGPTVNTTMELWIIPKLMLASALWPDGFTGANAAKTITSRNVLNALFYRAGGPFWQAIVTASSDISYPIYGSLLDYFARAGLALPLIWTPWIVHNTGVATNSTAGSHILSATGLHLAQE